MPFVAPLTMPFSAEVTGLFSGVTVAAGAAVVTGAIVAVFQKRYRKGDHIIRYAMVQVAN